MGRVLTLDLPEAVEETLRIEADRAGQSVEEWAARRLGAAVGTVEDRARALDRLRAYAGIVDLGRPTGLDNARIDDDLGREAADPHDDAR